MNAALAIEFATWKPSSDQYANVDTEVKLKLSTLCFFCNRPTLGALMGLGTDLGNAFKNPNEEASQTEVSTGDEQTQDEQAEEEDADQESIPDDASGNFCKLRMPNIHRSPCINY